MLQGVDGAALDRATCRWLLARARATNPNPNPAAPAGPGVAKPRVAGRGVAGGLVIAIDGKSARGARGPDGRAVHLLAAFDQVIGVVLGRSMVDGKTNESTAFAPLLDRIDITGAIVTADALHTQHRHAEYLTGRGVHYVLTLTDQLDELLDDGAGQVTPRLEPLRDALVAMPNPLAGLAWLTTRPDVARFLRGLANGEIELTHEAFHQLEPWRAAAHLRELLMSCGLLPEIDKYILSFERWLVVEHLPTLAGDAHRLIREFATWHVLPALRRRAGTRRLTPNTRRMAGSETKRAAAFLAWLDAHGRDLRCCAQADLDRWHAEHRGHEHIELRPFLQWAMRTGRMARLDVPRHEAPRRAPITQHHRVGLLRRLLTDDTAPLRARVAAVLMLLYAQPLSRIVRLTTGDVLSEADQLQLRLGDDPPVPVPEPFAALLVEHVAKRANMGTATNPNSTWLFPGRRAGQPLATRGPRGGHPQHGSADRPRPHRRPAPARAPGPRPGRCRDARLPHQAHRPHPRPSRRHLEPLCTDSAGGQTVTAPSTLIRDVRVFDGLQVSDADAVRLRGEIISEVGRGLTPEADEIVVDGAGATALPGLIDAHTHVFSGSLEQALAFGVTTELDMFADPHVVIALKTDARARRDLADLRSAGTGATVAGGQPTQLVARGYYPPFPTIGAATDLDRFVAERVAEGSDYLKLFLDAGTAVGYPSPTLDPATVAALVAAGHRRGLITVAHPGNRTETGQLLDARVDVLAHLPTDRSLTVAMIDQIAEQGTVVIPTLTVSNAVCGRGDGPTLAADPAVGPLLDPASQAMLTIMGGNFPLGPDAAAQLGAAAASIPGLLDRRVALLAGSDAGTLGVAHGASLHQELALLVDAIGMGRLAAALATPTTTRLPRDHGHLSVIDSSYGYLRQFTPDVLRVLGFAGGPAAVELLEAVDVLRGLNATGARTVPPEAPAGFVPARWRGYLDDTTAAGNTTVGNTTAYRHYWELCVLLCLRDALRSGDVHVPGSRRYADPTAYLISPEAWPAQRAEFCTLVGVPADPTTALGRAADELHTAVGELDAVLAGGRDPVRLDEHGELVIGPLSAEDLPAEVDELRDELTALVPFAPIVSVLIELDRRTRFLDCFTHAGGATPRSRELKRNLLAVIVSQATNLGLVRMADASGDRLRHAGLDPGVVRARGDPAGGEPGRGGLSPAAAADRGLRRRHIVLQRRATVPDQRQVDHRPRPEHVLRRPGPEFVHARQRSARGHRGHRPGGPVRAG